ncbi:MAG: YtxH domain-containing protein [Acidobacteriota bacterium]
MTRSSGGSRLAALIGGIGLGAAVMYALDPQGGRRRRAIARDKAMSFAKGTGEAVGSRSRDLGNRARGVAAEVRSVFAGKGSGEDAEASRKTASRPPAAREISPEFEEDGGI